MTGVHRNPEASQDTSWTQTLGCLAWGGLAKQLEAVSGDSENFQPMRCEIIGVFIVDLLTLTELSFSFHNL